MVGLARRQIALLEQILTATGTGGGGGTDLVGIKDSVDPTRKLKVNAAGQIEVFNQPVPLTNQQLVDGGHFVLLQAIRDRLPVTLDADGGAKVHIQNFPATQVVSGIVTANVGSGTQPVSGNVTADTELPTAAALSDTDANPTAPYVGSAGMVWSGGVWVRARGGVGDAAGATGMQNVLPMVFNGTNHDRLRGDIANGLDVDVTRVSGTVAVSLATNTPDVTDRSARLLGHVTVDNPTFPVTDNGGSLTVDGPVTDSQLRASPVPVVLSGGGGSTPTFRGRACTFRTPGRAGTIGQNLLTIFNAVGSTKVLRVTIIAVDLYQTVIKAITVAPPIIRVSRLAAAPTLGTTLAKVAEDTNLATDANVELRGDASADGTSSATILTAVIGVGTTLTQEPAPRFITGAGYEPFDRATFFDGDEIVLRAGQGLVLHLAYTAATQNPITDMWTAVIQWTEEG